LVGADSREVREKNDRTNELKLYRDDVRRFWSALGYDSGDERLRSVR
jgi:hypothetical protein